MNDDADDESICFLSFSSSLKSLTKSNIDDLTGNDDEDDDNDKGNDDEDDDNDKGNDDDDDDDDNND